MKTAPIFATLRNNAVVATLLQSGNFLKVFEFGSAPQSTAAPYVVWQFISGSPSNNVTCRPNIEEHLIQIDCYANSQAGVKELQGAVEYAIETKAKITSYRGNSLEPETGLWRASFDVSFFVKR